MSKTRSFIIDAASNYLRMVTTILGTLFLTRAMVLRWSVDEFGRWSIVTSVMSFALLFDLGLSNIVLKAASDRTDAAASGVLSSACMALICLSGMACLFLAVGTQWLLPHSEPGFFLVILALSLRATLASLPWTVCRSALYARGKMSITNTVQSIGILLYSLVACIALYRGATLVTVAVISLSFTALDSMLLVGLLKRYLPEMHLRPNFNFETIRPLLSLGGASILINIAWFVLLKTDPLIVKTFLPFAQVAIYAVALRIAENVFLLCKQLVNALTPHAIRAGLDGGTEQGARIFERASRYVMALGAPIYVCTLILGRQGIRLWLSPSYEGSAVVLNILLLAMVLSIPQLVGSNLLTFSGHHKSTATFISAGAGVNVIASIILVRVTGVTGIAYGTLFTTVLIDIAIMVPYACRALHVGLGKFGFGVFRSIVLPGVLQAVALTFLQRHLPTSTLLALFVEGASSCLVFLIAFVVFGATQSERSTILNALFPTADVPGTPIEVQ